MYAEGQRCQYQGPPKPTLECSSPVQDRITEVGDGCYTSTFHLDIPDERDPRMDIVFNQSFSMMIVGSTGT